MNDIIDDPEIFFAYIEIARKSKNPTVQNALTNLIIALKLVEEEKIESELLRVNDMKAWVNLWRSQAKNSPKLIHDVVDFVLLNPTTNTIAALENFIECAGLFH